MSKQLLAKCGVFVLIVVNLGAYYMFWPDSGSSGAQTDKPENLGNSLQLASTAGAAQPSETAKPAPTESVHLPGGAPAPAPRFIGEKDSPTHDLPPIPNPLTAEPAPVVVAQVDDPTIEKLRRLKASFEKEKEGPAKPAPVAPPPPAPVEPKVLTAHDPVMGAAPPPAPIPGAPPAPKASVSGKSPWTLQWQINDGRTMLNAKLNKRLDFRIECDGIKMETHDGALAAIGNVVFSGPGLRGMCQQLTISLNGDSVVLEGKAELHVQQGNPTDIAVPTAELKGERFALRLQQTAGSTVPANAPRAPLNIGTEPLVPAPGPLPQNSVPSPFTLPK